MIPTNGQKMRGLGECVASSGHILVAHGVYANFNDPNCAAGLDFLLGALANVFSGAANYSSATTSGGRADSRKQTRQSVSRASGRSDRFEGKLPNPVR